MTKEEAIRAALSAIDDGKTRFRSREPVYVKENEKLTKSSRSRGWLVAFDLDYPEWPEHERLLVEVYEPSGEVVVLYTL